MLPKNLWEKLPRLEQKKILWWVRLRWLKFRIDQRFHGNTPAPVRFAIKTALVAFAILFLLPHHPLSMAIAMACGLYAAIITHTPDPRQAPNAPSPSPSDITLLPNYTYIDRQNGRVKLLPSKTIIVHKDGTIEEIDRKLRRGL